MKEISLKENLTDCGPWAVIFIAIAIYGLYSMRANLWSAVAGAVAGACVCGFIELFSRKIMG